MKRDRPSSFGFELMKSLRSLVSTFVKVSGITKNSLSTFRMISLLLSTKYIRERYNLHIISFLLIDISIIFRESEGLMMSIS